MIHGRGSDTFKSDLSEAKAGSMLSQRLRRWPNIESALAAPMSADPWQMQVFLFIPLSLKPCYAILHAGVRRVISSQVLLRSVFSYKLRYIMGFWLVEMTISTNQKPTIYRNLYENTGPAVASIVSTLNSPELSDVVQLEWINSLPTQAAWLSLVIKDNNRSVMTRSFFVQRQRFIRGMGVNSFLCDCLLFYN